MEIRPLRKKFRISQAELSQHTNINRTRLSFAENGYVQLTEAEQASIRSAIKETAEKQASAIMEAFGDR